MIIWNGKNLLERNKIPFRLLPSFWYDKARNKRQIINGLEWGKHRNGGILDRQESEHGGETINEKS